jgi:putative nucleotidyltransferase with HDIG domain
LLPDGAPVKALEHPLFRVLGQLAHVHGWELYVIGGYVRDYLIGQPSTDVDIVCVGDGLAVAQAFQEAIGARQAVFYGQFGTAMVETPAGWPTPDSTPWKVEFVGARKESYRPDSRKPNVQPGTLHDDQLRRDFTVNALGISLNPDTWGELADPFNGLHDLQQGVLRTPTDPDVTFSDDPLRMLRATRFASRLGYEIHPDTWAGIERNAERIGIVSQERIAEELNKTLRTPEPSIGFKLLFRSGLLQRIFPELHAMHGVELRNGIGHKDNFYHTLKVLDNLAAVSPDVWLRWGALLHDIGKPRTKRFTPGGGWSFHGHDDVGARMVPKIFARLKLPQNEHLRFVQKMVALHQRPIALASGEVTDAAIRRIVVDAGDDLDALLMLCRADITTKDPRKHARYLANYDALEQRIYEVLERDRLRNWQPALDGQDIMQAFNLPPGPLVGQIKQRVRDAVLDGLIPNDRDAALVFARTVANELGV